MSGIELAALAAMGAAYLDARYGVREDFYSAKALIEAITNFKLALFRDQMNMMYVFNHWVKKHPNKLFLVYPEPVVEASLNPNDPIEDCFVMRRYTYRQTSDIIRRYSEFLAVKHGIKARDVVAVDFVNKPELVFVWFALWNLGAIPAMINYNLVGKSLEHCVIVCGAKLLIVDSEVEEAGRSVNEALAKRGISTLYSDSEQFAQVTAKFPPRELNHISFEPSDPALYIFTSGTTGLPKAANLSLKKSMWGSRLYAAVSRYRADDVLYSAMPLYHSTAAALGLMATVHTGGTYAIGHKFSTSTFWTQARLCNATAIQYVGETGRYLLNAPDSKEDKNHNVRVAHGNGMRSDVWLHFKERFNIPTISEFYAATEYPTAINNIQQGTFGVGACGHYGSVSTYLLRNTKWDIVAIDPDTQEIWRDPKTGFGRRTNAGESGEFVFRIDKNDIEADFQGYAGNKEATDEKVTFDVLAKGDAFVRSGDLLRMNEDGHIFFVDRLGDTFRWKSENVSTNEVEEAITEIGNVDLVVVVGVKVPQHEGRAGFAVIQLHDKSKLPDMKKLAEYLLGRLPRYAVPIFIKFIDENKHSTGNNKVQKKLFRDQKIPAPPGETIYWLDGKEYRLLTPEAWKKVESGSHKL